TAPAAAGEASVAAQDVAKAAVQVAAPLSPVASGGDGRMAQRDALPSDFALASSETSAGSAAEPDLPPAPDPVLAKVETLRYGPEQNPVRRSGELLPRAGTSAVPKPADDSRELPVPALRTTALDPSPVAVPRVGAGLGANLPAAATPTTPALPGPSNFLVASAAMQPAARTADLDRFFSESAENVLGEGLAALPREHTRPTTAVRTEGVAAATPESLPAAESHSEAEAAELAPAPAPVPAVADATIQAPALPLVPADAAGSLIGDRCDPSRAGQSAVPLIVWVAVVVLAVGGVTFWLTDRALHLRTQAIERSQAYLRLSDLAVAEGECFARPHTAAAPPGVAGATRSTDSVGGEPQGTYVAALAPLAARGLLNADLWDAQAIGADAQAIGADAAGANANANAGASPAGQANDPSDLAPRTLATVNGYRYVFWFKRQVDPSKSPVAYTDAAGRLTRGFAVAAVPIDGPNWAYAIDDRGRMIEWRTEPSAGAAASGPESADRNDPVATGTYPADSDFEKIPIR
ncbi:MAG: hypothetical protein ACREJ2_00160, partial [Planctomycetota bacterium]